MDLSKELNIASLDKEIHRIQKSTRTLWRHFHPLHNHLRQKYAWYYNWHLQPFAHMVHWSALGLYLAGMAVFGYTLFQHPAEIKAASQKSWATAEAWSEWQLDGLESKDNTLVLSADKGQGTATIVFNPKLDEAVDWLSSTVTANGQAKAQFSTDNILWNDKIEHLADSKNLYAKIVLNKDEVTPSSISSFDIKYSRYPTAPKNLNFSINKSLLSTKQVLSAGAFADPDADLHAASQWQITKAAGNYTDTILDSGKIIDADLASYAIPNKLPEGTYYFRVRYQDSVGAWSLWSNDCAFVIAKDGKTLTSDSKGDTQQIANTNELISSRTETTKTIDNKNNTRTLEAYTGIIHYKEDYAKADSQWLDINPEHSIDTPSYVLYDQMPSTVKVFKDKIGYEIESRKTGDKYTVSLKGVDGNPVLSKSKGIGSKVAWADINTPAEKQQKDTRNALSKWIAPSVLANEPAVDDSNLKFEFDISEYGVRLWKTIKGNDAPKNFTWDIQKTNGTKDTKVDDLKFRDNPEAFEVINGVDAKDKQIKIEAKKIDGIMSSSFVWQETAPKTDIKIDTDVIFYPNADPETTTVDGALEKYGATWSEARDAATADITDDTAVSFYGAHVMNYDNSTYAVARSFFSFDLSPLVGESVTGATFSVYGESKATTNSADPDLGLFYSSGFASNTALSASDYASVGSSPLASTIAYADFSSSGYNNFSLNTTGLGYVQSKVDTGGVGYLAMRTVTYDMMNNAPSTVPGQPHGGDLNVYFSDQAGTSQDPKLAVTYSSASTTPNVWVANYNNGNVSKFNITNGAKFGDYETNTGANGVAVDANGFVWITNSEVNTVSKINATTGAKVGDYATGSVPVGVAVDANGFVWVANQNSGNVSKFNGNTGAKVGDYATGTGPHGIAADPDGFIWVTNSNAGTLSKLDVTSGAKIGDYATGYTPYGVAVDANGFVWVASMGSNTVSKFNTATGANVGDYTTNDYPYGVAVDANGFVWVTNTSSDNVSKFNGTTGAKVGDYATGSVPYGIAVDSNGFVWIESNSTGYVTKLNGSNGSNVGNYYTYATGYSIGDMTGFALQNFVLGGAVAPTVTTSAATDVAATSFTANGNVTSDGGDTVTDRGFFVVADDSIGYDCTGLSSGAYTSEGYGTGVFSKSIGSLTPGTHYCYQAAATNSAGTGVGAWTGFLTLASNHTLTYSAGANGSIVGTSPQTVNHGADGSQVTATPAANYHWVSWSDGYPTAARTDTNVTGDITVSASFAINTYTLTYSAGANGSIVGTTPQTVNHGADGSQVTATPAANYHWVSWSDAYPTAARTDTNITANKSVTASFAINTYTLTYSAGANGSITGTTPQTVNHGADGSQVTATPVANYHWVSWSDAYPTAARTDLNVTGDITVSATFAIDTFTLNYSAVANGSIVGANPQTVDYNTNGTEVVATPAANYHWVSWSDAYPTATRTDLNVTANVTVSASFAINTYTVTASTDVNGAISPIGTTTKDYGSSQEYTFSANAGYHISTLIIDGTPQSALTSPFSFTNIGANHTIAITTVADNYCVWTGLGADNNWSTTLNWTGNAVPISTCDVIFNETSTKASTLDSSFTNHVKSLSINSGYTNTVTLAKDLDDDGSIILAAGTLKANNYTLNIGGSWTNTGGTFTADTSTVNFNGATASTVASNSNNFYRVTFAGVAAISTPNVWVANYNTNNVSKIDSANGSKTDDYPTASYSYGSAVDNSGFVWVTNTGNDTISKIDASTGAKIVDYPTGSLPKGVAIDASGFVWVANYGNGTVSKMNPSTGAKTSYATGAGATGVAVDNNGFVWISNYAGLGSVSKINASTGAKVGDYTVGTWPTGIAVDNSGFVWVANTQSNTVSKINALTGVKVIDYATAMSPAGVAIDANGFVWVTNTGASTVSKINPTTGAKTDYVTGSNPAGVSVDSNGFIWIANTASNTVSKMNPSSGAKNDYPAGTSPYSFGDMTGFALQKFVLGGTNSSSGSYALSLSLNVSDELTVASGIVSSGVNTISTSKFIQTGGYFNAPSTTLTLTGDFQRTGGVYARNSGTVSLVGSGGSTQVISGSTTFSNLAVTASVARTIQFSGDSSQAVLGTWTATGSAGQLLTLALKTGDSGIWNINPSAWSVNYVNVSNSTNHASTKISPTNYDPASLTANNTNWFSDVLLSHTITASVVSGNGTISPSGAKSVVDGQNQTFTIYPADGYYISDIKIDGASLSGTLANAYTFSNIITNHTIAVTFTPNDVCTWDGGATDENWSSVANWTNDIAPTAVCDVVFNGTSTKKSTIDAGFTSHIKSLAINTGYTGTVSASNNLNNDGSFTLNSGTFLAGTKTINIAGSLSMVANPTAVFDKGTSTINFNPTATGKTITTNGQQLGNLTFNGVDADLTGVAITSNNNIGLLRKGIITAGWTLQDNLSATSLAVNSGTLVDAGKSVTVAGSIYITYKIGLLASTGLWTQSASGNISNYDMRNAFGSLTIAGEGIVTNMIGGVKVGLNEGSVGALTMGPGTINGNNLPIISYMPKNNALTINNPVIASKLGTFTLYPLGNISQKAITFPNNFAPIQIQKGPSSKYTATGDFNFGNNNLNINNDNNTANTGYVDMGPYTLTCNNLIIGSAFGSARFPAYYQIAGGLKITTGAINVSGNLSVGNALNFGNRLYLGSGTLTVGGNFDTRYVIITESTSTVDLVGTGTLATSSSNYFYNLRLSHPGKTTTITSDLIRVHNILYTYSGGTLVNGWAYLYKSDGDPFIDTGATLTNNTFLYMSRNNIEVSGHNMKRVYYRAYTNNVTYTLTSDLVAETIVIYSNTEGKVGTLNTSTKNIRTNSISLGSTSSPENMTYSGAIDFGTGNHVIGGSVRRNINSPSLDSSINFNKSTVRIGGDIDFSNLVVTPAESTIILSGAANSTQTFIGNNTFNNLTFENTGARTIQFAGDTTQNILGTWTAVGAAGKFITLALKNGDTGIWKINPANWVVDYVNVSNSINLASARILPKHYIDGGGSENWFNSNVVSETISDVVDNVVGAVTTVTTFVAETIKSLADSVSRFFDKIGVSQKMAAAVTAVMTGVAAAAVAVAGPIASTASSMSALEFIRSLWQSVASLVTKRGKKKWGRVIDSTTGLPVSGAKVTLVKIYREDPKLPYETIKVVSSVYTDKDGRYGFVVEPAKYKLEVLKDKYQVVESNSFLDFYHPNTLIEVKDYKAGLLIKDIALAMENAEMKKSAKIVLAVQSIGKISGYVSFGFLLFGTYSIIPTIVNGSQVIKIVLVLFYLALWAFNLKNLFARSPWGTVIAEDKKTIDLALIRVIDSKSGQLIKTTASNSTGRFSILVNNGQYNLNVVKDGYTMEKPEELKITSALSAVDKTIILKKT
jgi:streptogramin lyase/5-hydroxyisourate hydrolase-like protein (transthyretin family)